MMVTAGQSFIDMLSGFNDDTNYEDNLSFPDILNLPQTPSISLPEGYLGILIISSQLTFQVNETNILIHKKTFQILKKGNNKKK